MAGTSINQIGLRRYDLDNLRTALTTLVTVHHSAIPYGGLGSWMFHSDGFEPASSPTLMGMNVFNQSFFMGLFFWVSGRVTAQSLTRNPPSAFLRSKVVRLGVPALVYSYVVDPVTRAAISGSLDHLWNIRHGLRGPMWYLGSLLLFDSAAVLTQKCGMLGKKRDPKSLDRSRMYERLCRYAWIGVGLSSFLIRLWYPIGSTIPLMNLQPAFVLQYVYAYSLGLLSAMENEDGMYSPLDFNEQSEFPEQSSNSAQASENLRSPCLAHVTAISLMSMTILMLPPYLSSGGSWFEQAATQFSGGRNMTAFVYAIWNEFSFAIMAPALLSYFRLRHSQPTSSSIVVPRSSYAAFLLHTLVTVLI
ncbi:acyltransferase 3 [Xylariaceae sp. FL0255]|nr:acyltransferase 3 [Xylariaceae sp. FL0255]